MTNVIDLNNDFYQKLNTDKGYRINDNQIENFWNILDTQLKEQVVQSFGIQTILDKLNLGSLSQYKEGGNVSTLNNAHKGVFVDDEHARRFNKSYNRKDYEGRKGSDIDNRLSTQRKKMFQKNGTIRDAYTGKELNKDGSTHLDHVTSAKHIHENYKARLYMTDDERNDMAVDKHNMAPIEGRMNQSKGELEINEWLQKKKNGITNEERFGINKSKVEKREKTSKKFINKTVNNAAAREFNKAAKSKGVEQAKRQICGVAMYMISDIVIDELKVYVTHWNEYGCSSRRIAELKITFEHIRKRILETISDIKRWGGEIIKAAWSGFTSGILGTLITTIINSMTTTISAWGKIIQDGISSFISGFKILISNPEKLPFDELMKKVIKIIGIGLGTTVGLVIGEEFKTKLLEMPGISNFLVEAISTVTGAMISGFLSSLVIFTVDNFGKIIRKFESIWSTAIDNSKISIEQVRKSYNETIQKIDDSYAEILKEIEVEYEKMGKIAELAHDMKLLASDQLVNSVRYARLSGVSENKILHDNSEIKNYFLGE